MLVVFNIIISLIYYMVFFLLLLFIRTSFKEQYQDIVHNSDSKRNVVFAKFGLNVSLGLFAMVLFLVAMFALYPHSVTLYILSSNKYSENWIVIEAMLIIIFVRIDGVAYATLKEEMCSR